MSYTGFIKAKLSLNNYPLTIMPSNMKGYRAIWTIDVFKYEGGGALKQK
jgi:hypothetical protein